MSAYLVFTRLKTVDAAELGIYEQQILPTLGTFNLKALVAYGKHETLEGPEIEGLVIVQFPTVADAKDWYESPAYESAREHRFKGAEYTCVLVEGL